jgi:uncharacterized membrane protein YphA (DoxX/SURF4 family)
MLEFLDALHARARRWPPFARLAIITRILLAMAFIPTGMVKLLGERFTAMPVDTPVGFFFEAMYQSGFYWNFLGLGQVMAGILLLIPATATLGAVAFFPIILNITVVTWSVGFKGTIYITPLILLASIFLLCWDWDRLRWIIFEPAERPALPPKAPLPMVERLGYLTGGITGMIFFLWARGFVPRGVVRPTLILGGAAVLMVLVGWFQAAKRQTASG